MTGPRLYQGSLQPRCFPSMPANWVSESDTFPSADGKVLLYAALHHPRDWKGHRALIILHGFGEHGGRYLHFPHYLGASGQPVVDAVYCLDHRGHGRSEGQRGHVENFDDYSNDVVVTVNRLDAQLKQKFGKSEITLLGHSMGGLVGLRTLFQNPNLPIRAVAISAPLLGIRVPVPALKKLVAMTLTRLWGSLHMATDIDPRELSHDPEVVAAYAADRLVHKKITPRFFTELQRAMADVMGRHEGFHYPMQMMIPLKDQVVNPDRSLAFFEQLKLNEKKLITYPDFFHEPFNEVGKEQVFADLGGWVKANAGQ